MVKVKMVVMGEGNRRDDGEDGELVVVVVGFGGE